MVKYLEEVNGFGLLDLMATIKRRQGRYLALILSDLETYMLEGNPSPDFDGLSDKQKQAAFQTVRKYILDTFNDYTRSIFNLLLGDDIENLNFR